MAEESKPFKTFQENLLEYLEASTRASGLRSNAWDQTQLTVHRTEGYLPIPEEILMDEGVIPDTRPARPVVKLRWRTRARWRITTYRERFGLWAYWVITGDRIKTDND